MLYASRSWNTFTQFRSQGGGTAGLTVATRLSENSSYVVGVLEGGVFHQNDPLIDVPANSGNATGNPAYDWDFQTTPQSSVNGRTIAVPRGKMLGGSSGLNLMAWNRPSKDELDILQTFSPSNEWNWDGLIPYFKKSTSLDASQSFSFTDVSGNKTSSHSFDTLFEDFNGPVNASFNDLYPTVVPAYMDSFKSIGISANADPDNGSSTGIYNSRLSVDRPNGVRSYAAPAYYCPASSRGNLHVLTNAQVTKIVLQNSTSTPGFLEASGVQFVADAGTFTASVKREVLLSAGTVQTPQLLELSGMAYFLLYVSENLSCSNSCTGIGNATLLESLGVAALIDLPQVGENLQEHLFVPLEFLLKPGSLTFDELRINATFAKEAAAQYSATRTGWLAASDSILAYFPFQSFVDEDQMDTLKSAFLNSASQGSPSPFLAAEYDIQRQWINQTTVPQVETILFAKGVISPNNNESYITVLAGLQHPLSRGSVHINSSQSLAQPVIAANYLEKDFDTLTLLHAARLIINLANTTSLSSIVQNITSPAGIQSDSDLVNYIKNTLAPGDHLIGTAAMGPQELGGVVDSSLKIYGTTNMRVVDASIIPLHLAAHPQTLVYAIGEKAADMIQSEASL
ncbi:alcohol oxidase [Stereum hirsutum FP-91666 SS1]|uniref:alcohol oxidase n=1 Tax=Stereum hirsutum (strain FP-91666) TaxID=721885 RepID=UPI000444A672|nr:alcohol oxidase [Stereum hirsutum FP-91666 SS1]EIM81801.1 alcohol oxidase [Stereum hirsutum FP-91666 SS1]